MVHKINLRIPKNWVLDTEPNYIAFSEGVYYKVNNAIVYRIQKKEVVLRNTYTGKEKVLAENISKSKALNFMRDFIRKGFERM
jgi:hypothetical protein